MQYDKSSQFSLSLADTVDKKPIVVVVLCWCNWIAILFLTNTISALFQGDLISTKVFPKSKTNVHCLSAGLSMSKTPYVQSNIKSKTTKKDLPKWGTATDDAWTTTRQTCDGLTAEERVVLDASLPEVLAWVSRAEVELDCVFVVTLSHINVRLQ